MASGVIQKEPRYYPLSGDTVSHQITTSGDSYTATKNGYILCEARNRSGDARVASITVNGTTVCGVLGILNNNIQYGIQVCCPIHKGDIVATRNLGGNEMYTVNFYYTD